MSHQSIYGGAYAQLNRSKNKLWQALDKHPLKRDVLGRYIMLVSMTLGTRYVLGLAEKGVGATFRGFDKTLAARSCG